MREMKIGQQGVDPLELVGRVDEDVRAALAAMEIRRGFEHAGGGGADSDDAVGRFVGRFEAIGDGIDFLVHFVIEEEFGFDGPEGAKSHMKRNEGVGAAGEQFRGEMETRRRSRDRSGLARVDGLVALEILGRVLALAKISRRLRM